MSNDNPTPRRKPSAASKAGARRLYRDAALKQGRGFTPDKQAEYIAALAKGMRRGEAAAVAEVSSATVRDYQKKDPAFAAACVEAEEAACDVIETALWDLARGGHLTAIMFYLQNRAPDRWRDMRRVEKKVTHEGTVTHELEAGATMQRIAELQATLAERKALRSGQPDDVIDVDPID